MATHYEALGISHRASLADIQRAHRQLAAQFHPDLHPGDRAAHEKFKAIQLAYDVLADETRRRAYDEHLQRKLEAKADRWFARTIRGLRTSGRRHHRHRSHGGWRPLPLAAAGVAAAVLIGSTVALVMFAGQFARQPAMPDRPLAATDSNPALGADSRIGSTTMGDVAAQSSLPAPLARAVASQEPGPDRLSDRPLLPVPPGVKVSNPSPRDFYRPPARP